MKMIDDMVTRAVAVKSRTALLAETEKNQALQEIADALRKHRNRVLEANRKDLQNGKEAGLSEALLDRLLLDENRLEGIASAVEDVVRLADPVGGVLSGETMRDGMLLRNVRVPLGVCGIIYESRPNVTVDAAALCLKSGNVSILKGGKEAIHSNTAMMELMQEALQKRGLPPDMMQLVEDTGREATLALIRREKGVDVLIPRGGAGLIASVMENAKVPVIQTGTGNNHLFVDADADPVMAEEILANAKTPRPSVCNAIETLLVHRDIAPHFLPRVKQLMTEHQIELRVCKETLKILDQQISAAESDWETEYIDRILAVRIVDDLDAALSHINRYGSGHSEAIVTRDYHRAHRFQQEVDAAAVYVNCSTRFTDGGEFGLGAEIGISTQKLHVRGPMGLEALTGNKYLISGQGQTRK